MGPGRRCLEIQGYGPIVTQNHSSQIGAFTEDESKVMVG